MPVSVTNDYFAFKIMLNLCLDESRKNILWLKQLFGRDKCFSGWWWPYAWPVVCV